MSNSDYSYAIQLIVDADRFAESSVVEFTSGMITTVHPGEDLVSYLEGQPGRFIFANRSQAALALSLISFGPTLYAWDPDGDVDLFAGIVNYYGKLFAGFLPDELDVVLASMVVDVQPAGDPALQKLLPILAQSVREFVASGYGFVTADFDLTVPELEEVIWPTFLAFAALSLTPAQALEFAEFNLRYGHRFDQDALAGHMEFTPAVDES